VENHFHGRVLLIYEYGVIGTIVEKDAKTLGIEIILVGHLHGEIGGECAGGERQSQKEPYRKSGEYGFHLVEREHLLLAP
jgi:phosphoglycerate dehydrogenase-like enzyme